MLKYSKTSPTWVPKKFTQHHQETTSECEGEPFLNEILTCDDTFVQNGEPDSKGQGVKWKHTSSPVRKKFKTRASARKVMLAIIWMPQLYFGDYLEDQRTGCSADDSHILMSKVKPAMRGKGRQCQTKDVIILHNNARPHTAQLIQESTGTKKKQ
ncbi:histone-lysine N-methyltransferase SETMAR-like [Schistocerca cancellata]|uniref:histone-lysine N-methyltransferase SETMAR-like n=1 Tax=Schistocerca cancellata TaxID=274614 RepID=UPI0021183EF3|nr:histone-lysine N-methyltransferase SETMAR-like [Schistocerca cancellata]